MLKITHNTTEQQIKTATKAELCDALKAACGKSFSAPTKAFLIETSLMLVAEMKQDEQKKADEAVAVEKATIEKEQAAGLVAKCLQTTIAGLADTQRRLTESLEKFFKKIDEAKQNNGRGLTYTLRWYSKDVFFDEARLNAVGNIISFLRDQVDQPTMTWKRLNEILTRTLKQVTNRVLDGSEFESNSTCPISNAASQYVFKAQQWEIKMISAVLRSLAYAYEYEGEGCFYI